MVNYSELRDIQKKEMESSAITTLSDDFYASVSQLLSSKKIESLSSKSLLSIKEFENTRRILMTIQLKREEKIVLMAVRGDNGGVGLTAEERELLKELNGTLAKARDRIRTSWDNDEATPATAAAVRRIRILQDVSQYKGLDNATYGPFKKGEERSLPPAEADWLLKARMAELQG